MELEGGGCVMCKLSFGCYHITEVGLLYDRSYQANVRNQSLYQAESATLTLDHHASIKTSIHHSGLFANETR